MPALVSILLVCLTEFKLLLVWFWSFTHCSRVLYPPLTSTSPRLHFHSTSTQPLPNTSTNYYTVCCLLSLPLSATCMAVFSRTKGDTGPWYTGPLVTTRQPTNYQTAEYYTATMNEPRRKLESARESSTEKTMENNVRSRSNRAGQEALFQTSLA